MDQIAKRRGILLVSSIFFSGEADGGNPLYFNPTFTQCDENGGLEGDAEQVKSDLEILATYRLSEGYEHKLYGENRTNGRMVSHGKTWPTI